MQSIHMAMLQRSMTEITSHSNGWYMKDAEKHVFSLPFHAVLCVEYRSLYYKENKL